MKRGLHRRFLQWGGILRFASCLLALGFLLPACSGGGGDSGGTTGGGTGAEKISFSGRAMVINMVYDNGTSLVIATYRSSGSSDLFAFDSNVGEFRCDMGEAGETLVTSGGPIECGGLPVLADREGVKASPWVPLRPTDLEGCREPVFVCYLPKPLFRRLEPKSHMGRAIWLTWAYRFVFERTCSYREPTP